MKKTKQFLMLSSAALLVLSACGGGNSVSNNSSEPDIPQKEVTINNLTQFDEDVSLYTDLQKQFFALEGEDTLANLTSAQMKAIADGSKNLSSPQPVKLEWEHEPEENFDHYEIEFAIDGDFDNPVIYNAGKSTSYDVYNLQVGKEYSYRVLGYYNEDSEYFEDPEISDTLNLTTEDGPIQNYYIDGITNCRDLGGKELASGGKSKTGVLYRTSSFHGWDNGSAKISDKGREQIKQFMPFKSEIELRGGANGTGGEANKTDGSQLEDVNFFYVPWAYEGGKNLIFRNVEPLRKVFDVLGDPNNYPLDFHCRIGTDRTGAVAMLVNGLIGVSVEDIYRDYLFSNFGQINTNSNPRIIGSADSDSCRQYIEQIREFPGTMFHNKVYNFLASIGVETYKLDNIINIMTEGNKVTNDRTIVTIGAEKFTTDQALTTVTNTRQPANAVKLSANGKKVEYKVKAEKDVNADLYVGLLSRSTSGKLSTNIKVTVDGTVVTPKKDYNFTTTDLGFASGNDFWQNPLINTISLKANTEHTIAVERISSVEVSVSQFVLEMDGAVTLS